MSGYALAKDPYTAKVLGTVKLVEELGVEGAVERLRLSRGAVGRGNYAVDRHEWLDQLTPEEVKSGIMELERGRYAARQAVC